MKPWNRLAHSYRSLSRFLSQEAISSISTSMDGMLVHHRSLPRNLLGFPDNSPVLIYTPGGERYCESKLSCSITQHSVPDQDRSIISGTSALTMSPPCLHLKEYCSEKSQYRSALLTYCFRIGCSKESKTFQATKQDLGIY